jgi:hypothetical protein
VLPLAPDVPKSAPGFAKWIDPLRTERVSWGALVPDQLTTAEKKITPLVIGYLKSVNDHRTSYGQFCQRLAIEAALHRPLLLPVIAFNKFLVATTYPPSGDFGAWWMQQKQIEACTYKDWMVRLMPRLAGARLAGEPDVAAALQNEKLVGKDSELYGRLKAAVVAFVQREYVPLGGSPAPASPPDPAKPAGNAFGVLQHAWAVMTTGGRVGEQHYGVRNVPGFPAFFILAGAGMLASICRPGPLRRVHIAWVITIGFVFTVVMLTGVMNPRYRFVFEPFCLLYIFTLLDFVAAFLTRRETGENINH